MESQGMHCGLSATKVSNEHDPVMSLTHMCMCTGDHLVFLDPHTTQQTIRPTDLAHIPDTSYHCNTPGYMRISDIDPSIAVVTYSCL